MMWYASKCMQSLASCFSKHDEIRQESKPLSPLKLLLSRDVVPAVLEVIIILESVMDFIYSYYARQ